MMFDLLAVSCSQEQNKFMVLKKSLRFIPFQIEMIILKVIQC